jgi:hypothetical protein
MLLNLIDICCLTHAIQVVLADLNVLHVQILDLIYILPQVKWAFTVKLLVEHAPRDNLLTVIFASLITFK